MVKKFFPALFAILMSFVTFAANAGLARMHYEQQMFRTVDGEYLLVTDLYDNPVAYGTVVDTMEKAGYVMTTGTDATTRMDTWCKIDIHTAIRITVACYSPNASFDLVVSQHVWWTPEDFKAYADVPAIVSQIREAHRRAAAAINTK